MLSSSVVIRDERPDDREAVRRVHLEAFGGDLEARLVELLRARNKGRVSLVAATETGVVGHVVFSPVSLPQSPAISGLGLGPMAVLPAVQRQGVGSRLVRDGINRCRREACDLVVVLGEPAYYQRFGFAPAHRFGLGNEYGVGDEFMVMELRSGTLVQARGVVKYASEFREVEL
jgi:putative acetyltransferase